MIPKSKLFLSLCAVFILQPVLQSEEIAAEALRFKTLNAVRTETAPIIDGNIDDEVWKKIEPINDFVQFEPYNLDKPTVKTEVRLLYDDNYLYVAFENYDPNPSSIMTRMNRRDDYMSISSSTDWVGFGFDSNDDDLTGLLSHHRLNQNQNQPNQ